MKLLRLMPSRSEPEIPRRHWSKATRSDPPPLEAGKVYTWKDLAGFNDNTLRGHLRPEGQTPATSFPKRWQDARAFIEAWIAFTLSPVADELGNPAGLFRPVVKGLRAAMEEMPECPDLPQSDVNYLGSRVAVSVANELRRLRELLPAENPADFEVEPEIESEVFDKRDWILVTDALRKLPQFKNLKQLCKFADDNPTMLRVIPDPDRPTRRRLAHAGDVAALEKWFADKRFDAPSQHQANGPPPAPDIGSGDVSEPTNRLAEILAKKQRKK